MDAADKAQMVYEGLHDRLLQHAINQRKKAVRFTGYCHFCYDQVESPNTFCDEFCQESMDKENRMRKINGMA